MLAAKTRDVGAHVQMSGPAKITVTVQAEDLDARAMTDIVTAALIAAVRARSLIVTAPVVRNKTRLAELAALRAG
jgi:hypothetical protein